MVQYLLHPYFLMGCVPLLSAVLGCAVKYVTRNDNHTAFKKEDLAVGLDLIITACVTYSVLLAERGMRLVRAQEALATVAAAATAPDSLHVAELEAQAAELSRRMMYSGWTAFGLVAMLWGVSTIVRKAGWNGQDDLRVGPGIVLPFFAGLAALGFVMSQAGQ